MPRGGGRYRMRKPAWFVALAMTFVIGIAGVAWAVQTYTWSGNKTVGDASQYGNWMNGVHELAVSVDKSVTPNVTYTHYVYVSDYALDGTYTNDTKCASNNKCLANYYVRSKDGGKTWSNPTKLPVAANTPSDRSTIATTGSTVVALYMAGAARSMCRRRGTSTARGARTTAARGRTSRSSPGKRPPAAATTSTCGPPAVTCTR
jgi:hypothetical protein